MSGKNGHKPYVPPPPEVLTYSADGLDVRLSIARADASSGTYRVILSQQATTKLIGDSVAPKDADMAVITALAELNEKDLRKFSEWIAHLYVYPSLIAATTSAEGLYPWPLSFEDWRVLPEPFLMAWEAKVFELNPHWKPKESDAVDPVLDDELQKKAPASAQE